MEWNNGKERALFEKEQAELRKKYLAAGMTEEQIQAMYDFDKAYLNLRQKEARHTQRLNITAFDEDSGDDEGKNPLIKKFFYNFAFEDTHFENDDFGWIEQITDKSLYKAVKSLTDKDKKILSLMIIGGFNVTQAAEQIGVSHQAISKKIKKFQIIFGKWLRKWLSTELPLEGD